MNITDLKQIIEVLIPILSISAISIVGFLLLMGLLRKDAKERRLARLHKLSEPQTLKRVPIVKKEDYFWKDPSIINAGSPTLIGTGLLFLYIIFIISISWKESVDHLLFFADLMRIPNSFLGFLIWVFILGTYKTSIKFVKSVVFLLFFSAALVFISLALDSIFKTYNIILALGQLTIMVIQSGIFSTVYGIHDAIEEFDAKSLYPFVDIITTLDKNPIRKLMFTQVTKTDYRFKYSEGEEKGIEIIFPHHQIVQIKILKEENTTQ